MLEISFLQKNTQVYLRLLLIFLGICMSVILLEIVLCLAGAYYKYARQDLTNVDNRDAKLIKIIALGESTTATQDIPAWPEFLEQELNARVGKRLFRVYNFGVAGTNTSAIAQRLYAQVMPLEPDIVITMMGINDANYFSLPVSSERMSVKIATAFMNLKTTKLLTILWRLSTSYPMRRLVYQATICSRDPMGDDDWARNYSSRYESLIAALRTDRHDTYLKASTANKDAESVIHFLNIHPFSYRIAEKLIEYFALQRDWKSVSYWSVRFLEREPYIRLCIMNDHELDTVQKNSMLLGLTDIIASMKSFYAIAQTNIQIQKGSGIDFEKQFHVALDTSPNEVNIDTSRIYNEIASYLTSHHVNHVAMQYPLLSIYNLKSMINSQNQTTFVGNEENFQRALQTHSYTDLFVDNFAGVFGHTTELGSRLIASSAADAVMSILPSKK